MIPAVKQSPGASLMALKAEANRKLEDAARKAVDRGSPADEQIKVLEAKLATELESSRMIHDQLLDALNGLDSKRSRINTALNDLPRVYHNLDRTERSLTELQQRLPRIRSQVRTIMNVYNSGRSKAQALTNDLEWMQMSFGDKLWRVMFTRTSPISVFEATVARLTFLIIFLLFAWQLSTVVDGAIRAYRYRLVWGDKLMS